MSNIVEVTELGDHIIIPRGKKNPYGSVTGPFNTIGGWGEPAGEDDSCPKCGSSKFAYTTHGYGLYVTNECPDCGYEEGFCS